ncbi:hypothetical protein J6590_017935 [Homalodisca vitripennis]|nr:hypothetical protein J6590_017935 [Homalodisca vitripennis]
MCFVPLCGKRVVVDPDEGLILRRVNGLQNHSYLNHTRLYAICGTVSSSLEPNLQLGVPRIQIGKPRRHAAVTLATLNSSLGGVLISCAFCIMCGNPQKSRLSMRASRLDGHKICPTKYSDKRFVFGGRDFWFVNTCMLKYVRTNLIDVQEWHITNRKCRDSGVQGQFDRSSLLWEMTVGVGGVRSLTSEVLASLNKERLVQSWLPLLPGENDFEISALDLPHGSR